MSDSIGILIGDLDRKFDAVIELIQSVQRNMATKDDPAEVKADVKIIKTAVTDLSRQVDKHEKQLAQLDAA